MKIILVRHGVTRLNKEQKLQGHVDEPLDHEGLDQANLVAKRLSNEKIDAIISSDLLRARKTAETIHAHHDKTPIHITHLIRETNFGAMELAPSASVSTINLKDPPLDYETYDYILARAKIFLKHIKKKFAGKTVVIVSHGQYLRAFVSAFMNKKAFGKKIKFDNTAVTILRVTAHNKHEIELINCTKHLCVSDVVTNK
jgi:probable phosphoglycerate mutase